MAKNKTTYTDGSVDEFLETYVDNAQKLADSRILIDLMEKWSEHKACMWGPSIIGFGNYKYTYASGHSGEAPILAFSPRKNALTLYIYTDTEKSKQLLSSLGKFKMTKACIYIKKLSDIDLQVLQELCMESLTNQKVC